LRASHCYGRSALMLSQSAPVLGFCPMRGVVKALGFDHGFIAGDLSGSKRRLD